MNDVVITGVGVVSALGEGRARFAEGLRAGVSPVTALQGAEWDISRSQVAAVVRGFQPAAHVPEAWLGRVGRHGAFAIACARLAVRDAGLRPEDVAGEGTSVVVACNFGGQPDPGTRPNALHLARTAPSTAAAWISLDLGAHGPGMVVSSASCAGAQALSLAALYVRTGKARRVLAGGVEAPLSPRVMQGLDSAGILSRRNADPGAALRPFDRERDGTVVGEGGAILLLETEADAVRRGARILARLAGTGDAMEAHHPYALAPDGLAARLALQGALREAETDPRSVDLVMSHGTGTRQNDAYEASVIASVLGTGPMVTATKPLTGHLLGGAGAIDAAAAVTSMAAGFVPAIANCDDPDVGLDLDLVRGAAREASPRVVAVMSHGLGGFSSALILRRP